ncbi:MAG: protein translocase subunit SecD [Limnohabitans sp.]|nr:protein translocase subunit SecD [Limnohabitans sp.]
MNRYSIWRYAVIVIAMLVGSLYTLPNFFGEAPAVQISSTKSSIKVDSATQSKVEEALRASSLQAQAISLEATTLKVRFNTTDEQLKAKDAIQRTLNPQDGEGAYVIALNLISRSPQWLSALNAAPMYLGLDLRGGVHFMLQVDMPAALKSAITGSVGQIRSSLREKKIRNLGIEIQERSISLNFGNQIDAVAAQTVLSEAIPKFEWTVSSLSGTINLIGLLRPKELLGIQTSALNQNIEILHKRVNQLGVAEPLIQQQGADRIVVQLPGVQDTARAKSIIGRTATLQIRLVEDGVSIPSETVPQKSSGESEKNIGLKRDVIVSGDQIKKAAATIDKDGRPAVSLEIDDIGGRVMLATTRENLHKRMAIVLYEKGRGEAISVATIQGEFGNSFQITGNFTPQETADLALLTRAGSLAAPMEIIEERTIGPSLGAENIAKGFNSVTWGFVAVTLFMCIYYMLFGLISSIALAVNLLLLVAVLSMLQATLTLPGMAAMALVLGMAIDANVLINERVREELRNGAAPQTAIHTGYERAWSTILDSNVTTLIAGLALLAFGSGPVRGFAVVHCLGILTSMFSAVFFSRGLVNLWYGSQKKLKSVSIGTVWRPDGTVGHKDN